MNNYLVSVYIPTKNRLALLKRAISSVLEQTYKNIELIVVDDGSTDGTCEYLLDMQNNCVLQAIFLPISMGACVARNLAIIQSKGDLVTGLDDDDFFLPERIERFVSKWIQLEEDEFVGAIAGLIDDVTSISSSGKRELHIFQKIISYQDLLEMNKIGNQVFAPRQHFLEAGLFDPGMPMWQDWDLWRRMSKFYGNFINLGIGTYVVDQSHNHERITSKPEFMIRYAKATLEYKCGVSSQRVKSSLLLSCLSYPQAKPTLMDILQLAKTGRLRSLIRLLKKMFPFG